MDATKINIPEKVQLWLPVCAIIIDIILTFFLDTITPLGIIVWLFYIIPIFLTIWLRQKPAPFIILFIVVPLTWIGFVLSSPGIPVQWAVFNRIVGCILFVFLALGIWIYKTERKRTDEALQQARHKIKLLSSITRHDINNQLTVLRGYLQILEDQMPDSKNHEYFLKASNATQRISDMIRFTKEYEEIGIHISTWQNCHSIVDSAAKQIPPGKVIVINDIPVEAEVFADPLIIKVFYNLMENAVCYGGKITTIRFSVEKHEGGHIIFCEDDGEGIPADQKAKIFERGFGKNTGLGLNLSREILNITGITITETGEPGKGARFEMNVPKGMYRTGWGI
jgi:signal transduction histidine kinase